MAYNSTTKMISGSVSHTDINNCLGTAYKTNRELCTAQAINPASKIKPINFPATRKLTTSERKGYLGDQSDGIYFGLKCGTAISHIREIHTADWSYVGKPTGGESSAYRLGDFDGYHHIANLKVTGEGITDNQEVVISAPRLAVRLVWEHNNTTGVDIGEVFGEVGAGIVNYTNMCMCIMIGTYVTAMENITVSEEAEYGKYSPIVTVNSAGEYVYNSTYDAPDIIEDQFKTEQTLPVTIFFVHKEDISQFQGVWRNVGVGGDGAIVGLTHNPITLPNQVNKSVKFVLASNVGADKFGKWTGALISRGLTGGITVSFNCSSAPTEECNYKVILVFGGQQASVKTFTMAAGSLLPPLLSWEVNELGLVPITGEIYQAEVWLYGVGTNGDTLLTSSSALIEWTDM